MRNIILCLTILGITFCSCIELQQTTKEDAIDGEKKLSIECFQTLGNESFYSDCLAKDNSWNIYYIFNATLPNSEKTEVYYDGKSLDGMYVFVGTFTYNNKDGDKNTVPAYMSKSNFLEWYNNNKQDLIKLLDTVLSYNNVK